MEDKEIAEKIKNALLQGTNQSVDQKDILWKNIKDQTINKQKGVIDMTRKKKPTSWLKIAAVAAGISLLFVLGTDTGQAAVNKLKDLLVPEKIIVDELEGQKEENKVSLQESKVGYTIYIDENMYVLESNNGKDKIIPKNKPTGDYPEVFMEIQQLPGKKPADAARETEAELEKEYASVENMGKTEEPLLALLLRAKSGLKWNDTVVNYYFIDNTKGGTFVIKQQYFIEAAEGHGARFYNMLKEFRIKAE